MLPIRDSIANATRDAIASLVAEGSLSLEALPDQIELERPRSKEHGDWSTNVSMILAKAAGKAPREIAQLVIDKMPEIDSVEAIEVQGPGFINFHLADTAWSELIRIVVDAGPSYGANNAGEGAKVNLEYVSANPTGPMHLGHARWAAWGDALARLMAISGYDVTREFYVNDAGNQLDLLGRSLAARYLQAIGIGGEVPEDGYQGEYLVELASELKKEVGDEWGSLEPTELDERCGVWGCERLTAQIVDQLSRLGVEFDVWFSEREMRASGAVEKALDDLRELGELYEKDGALWLATSKHGDDKDRVVIKSDGSYTYLAGDIAYHRDKFARGFGLLIDLWGADHAGHVPKMRAAVEALGYPVDQFEVILGQLVSLNRAGEPVRMSKRSGDVYTYEELVDEIGPDAARFHFLMQGPDSALNLDLDAIVAQSMENPVFYVQMAHARICSIQAKGRESGISAEPIEGVDLSVLVSPDELALLEKLDEYPQLAEDSAIRRSPHRLTEWARELAGIFHRFYQDHRVLDGPAELVQARLWLIEACRIGLDNCLGILGVGAPEAMERLNDVEAI